MHQAGLPTRADDRVVGPPGVGDQLADELVLEELRQGRTTPTPVDQKVGQIGRREAPEPVGLAVDPPAGLVGVEDCSIQCLGLNLQIPGEEDRLEPIPHLDQTAGSDLERQMMVKSV